MKFIKKSVSILLAVLIVMTALLVGTDLGTLRASAAGWNGYNYGGGTLYGYQTFLQAYGIDYDVYMKWLDDHDADSPNPDYYLGTPYVGEDHRNPHGDCKGAYGAYDVPGVEGMNCTGFVWHVLYKSAVNSGAPSYKINRLGVMSGMPSSWFNYGVYRIYFNSIEEAYNSGVLEKGDLFWIYGSSDSHNAIFYGDSPEDFIYWDSAGKQNRYSKVHSIGTCLGLWVAKVTQPNSVELHIDSSSGGSGVKFGTKYCIFDSKAEAQAAIDNPGNTAAWDKRRGTIVLNSSGHGVFRSQDAPAAADLWVNGSPKTSHSYFNASARKVSAKSTYYAVQWSHGSGISEDTDIHVFQDSGSRTPSGYRILKCYAPIKVDTPAVKGIKSVSDGVRITWDAVKGADRYRVYYKNSKGGWTRMTETASTSYIDADVKVGSAYRYTVRCVDKYGNFISDYNKTGWTHTYTKADTPAITDLQSTADGVNITWNAVEGAQRYRVYYKSKKGDWVRMTETADTTYTDEAIGKGTTYTYTVRCVDGDGDFISDYNKNGWKHTYQGVDTPAVESLTSEADGICLTWNSVEGVTKYRVYRQTNSGWTRLTETSGTEYMDSDVTLNSAYTYTVRCVNSKGYFVSDYNKAGWQCTYEGVAAPQVTEIVSEPKGIRLTWDAVDGAVAYRVYAKASNGWTRLAELSGTEYTDDTVAFGQTRTYTVRCVNSKGHFASDYDKAGRTCTYQGTATPQITRLESTSDGVKITWNAVEGAALYRVFYRDSDDWKRVDTVKGTELLDTDVTPGSGYTYTVRCVGSHDNYISDFDHQGSTIEYLPPARSVGTKSP